MLAIIKAHPGLNLLRASHLLSLPRYFPRATGDLCIRRPFSQMSIPMQPLHEPLALGTVLYSDTGREFRVEEALLERRIGSTFLCVYRARYTTLCLLYSATIAKTYGKGLRRRNLSSKISFLASSNTIKIYRRKRLHIRMCELSLIPSKRSKSLSIRS